MKERFYFSFTQICLPKDISIQTSFLKRNFTTKGKLKGKFLQIYLVKIFQTKLFHNFYSKIILPILKEKLNYFICKKKKKTNFDLYKLVQKKNLYKINLKKKRKENSSYFFQKNIFKYDQKRFYTFIFAKKRQFNLIFFLRMIFA